MKAFIEVLKQTAMEWNTDKVPVLGAALAYYTVFSLAPLLIITIAIAGFVFGEEAARGQIFDQLRGLIGDEGGKAMQDLVQNANSKPATGITATVMGIITLLLGASGVFGQVQSSLNQIWGVEPSADRGVAGIIKDRFLSFGFVLIVGFLLLVSLLATSAITFVATWLGGFASGIEVLTRVLDVVLTLSIVSSLFALMFKFLPDAHIAWKDVWIGGILTAILFSIGKFALGIYLGYSSVGSSFGPAGSLIVLLVWVYYSAQILFFGAEFTQVWANKCGSRVAPAEDAVAINGRTSSAAVPTSDKHETNKGRKDPGQSGKPVSMRPQPGFIEP
ncbi:MAG: YihY/virulence factor BrkB family protein [Candidatus Methylacidiphilales bacterium]|nr:YihY/virulence factor BrkB family protein [Candidatus Methylacidiphilales bacterium]